jgi:hypothetical protein
MRTAWTNIAWPEPGLHRVGPGACLNVGRSAPDPRCHIKPNAPGEREGAQLLTGGTRVGERGFFVRPTLFSGGNELTIAQEEIFGPVAIVTPFDRLDEAITLANATRYGLLVGPMNVAKRSG